MSEFTEAERRMAEEYAEGSFIDANFAIEEVVKFAFLAGLQAGKRIENETIEECARVADGIGSEQDARVADLGLHEDSDSGEVDAYLNQATAAHYVAEQIRALKERESSS